MVLIFSNKNNAYEETEKTDINQLFSTSKAPAAVGPFSKAFFAGDLLFCSGQIALDVNTMQLINGNIELQTRQVCRNISYLLEEYGLSLKNVVKTTIYLKDINDSKKVNDVYKNYFVLKPARTIVEVSRLQKGALIEIEIIAKR
ncbi:MAG: Rid family detoxifying hydrolase [Candidatus Gracilibacteria bacterium]|nr:Rid family detoxifying hydrolase [Candidatus Gracilibacteria bacterium]